MTLSMRMFQHEDDYRRLRDFLREVFLLNNRVDRSWQVVRLDYWRFFINEHIDGYDLRDAISLWETEDGKLAAFITPDGRGQAYLQVHPAYRTAELEDEMLATAERCLADTREDGQRILHAWAHPDDALRVTVLQARGYTRGDWPELQFCGSLEGDIPDAKLAEGYTIRALGDESEIPARGWLSWRVFHPDEPDKDYGGSSWYPSVQRCPLYRRDLDLVAVAPDGELAAFATVWFDDVTRNGYFEPVGTSPDHQRRGLSRAIMTEGLRRLKHLGATHATVSGYSEAAVTLYGSVMQSEARPFERWVRTF